MASAPHRKFRPRISDLNFEFRKNYTPLSSRLKLRSKWRAWGGAIVRSARVLASLPWLEENSAPLPIGHQFTLAPLCSQFRQNQELTPPLLKPLPFVRTRHIRPRLSCGKSNSALQSCNVEPSRCHNGDMKARAYRNKSESN